MYSSPESSQPGMNPCLHCFYYVKYMGSIKVERLKTIYDVHRLAIHNTDSRRKRVSGVGDKVRQYEPPPREWRGRHLVSWKCYQRTPRESAARGL